MVINHLKPVVFASALGVPFLSLLAPTWLTLMGVGPSWAVLWLLPWALVGGPLLGVFAGLSLGLILDAISLGDGSQVPALVLLGFWWGYLGRKGLPIERNFSLGLLSWIGSLVVGLGAWLQFLLIHMYSYPSLFNSWSFYTILCQSILTGLLAPLICSLLLMFFEAPRSSIIKNKKK